VNLGVHLYEDTRTETRIHAAESRVVVGLVDGRSDARVNLSLNRPALLHLREVLTAALGDLDNQSAALTTDTDSEHHTAA
jgi:hypothetical protein